MTLDTKIGRSRNVLSSQSLRA